KSAEPAESAAVVVPAPSADKPAATEAIAEAAPSSSPPPATKPPAQSLHDLCFEMCDRVKAKCPKSSFETCRLNCSKYDPAPDGCDDIVRQTLSCARDAADLVCANVAPESCGKSFRQITACAAGQKPSEAGPATTSLPSGFALYENAQEGVQAPMPTGAAAGGDANVVAAVKTADGALYSIRKLPRPTGKLSDKVFLKLGLTLFGRCSDKMKLQGMVEKPGRASINFTTKCADGTEEQGLFWATEKALFVASVKGPQGKLGPAETFLYGFEAK
ncbi:MAG TPA: hypothetical protein VNG33_21350, partial [Polyangiaceae bacterium]|nr:hypothetical protein [Polyangiaceae bacterium]